ncbi:MAG: hypothetical protein ACLPT6_04790 [Desulfobaccales bacterium]
MSFLIIYKKEPGELGTREGGFPIRGAKEAVKPGDAKKKEAKQVRAAEKKSAAPEKSQPEKK